MLQKILEEILNDFRRHFQLEKLEVSINLASPAFSGFESFVIKNNLSKLDKKVLAIALIPYIHPYFFNEIQSQVKESNIHPALFFYQETSTGSLFPLLQVALLALFGETGWEYILKVYEILDSPLFKLGILKLKENNTNEIKNIEILQIISVNEYYLKVIITNSILDYSFSPDFPAHKILTPFVWNDLVLNENTLEQLQDIIDFQNNRTYFEKDPNLSKIIKPGYKALFFGPSGTGKTLTANLLGKVLKKEVYRVDLAMMVSKFIGETEKNLESLFAVAEHKNWILFFDEADSLFGARTNISDSHDRYANQEVSFLLQRIEDFSGIVILASNLKGNIDKAFSRRFQAVIEFKLPKLHEREKLWKQSLSINMNFEKDIISDIAQKFEISGGSIINVIQYATLKALVRKDNILTYNDLKTGISRELIKDGKTI